MQRCWYMNYSMITFCDNGPPVVLAEKQNTAERPGLMLVFGAMLRGAFDPPIP